MLSLGALPESVAELAHLQHLNVMGTNLDKVPAKLGKLPSLVSLNLESCKLKALEGIGQLESLTALNARSNQITALPEELTALRKLEVPGWRVAGSAGGGGLVRRGATTMGGSLLVGQDGPEFTCYTHS